MPPKTEEMPETTDQSETTDELTHTPDVRTSTLVMTSRRGAKISGLFLCSTRRAALYTHTHRIHPIPIDVFVRLVMSRIRRAEAVVDHGI
jgi:hypothetical protein